MPYRDFFFYDKAFFKLIDPSQQFLSKKLEVKEESEKRIVTLNVTESEDDILNKAANILDKKLQAKDKPVSLH